MCGRFALGLDHDEIQQMHGYNVHVAQWVGRDRFVPRYNIAPRSQAPVIRRVHDEASNNCSAGGSSSAATSTVLGDSKQTFKTHDPIPQEENCASQPLRVNMQTMRWGLVPHFSKHEDPSLKTFNARSDALVDKSGGIWASIKGKKRCAVMCQGYYEWLKKGKERLPHFTKPKEDRLMLLAGLWDCVTIEGSLEPLWTFTIVTTEASKDFTWLHDRQPVILADEQALSVWLDTSSEKWTPQLSKLCQPYTSADHPLLCYPVPKEVGKVGNDSPTFVQPISERSDGIEAMFAIQSHKESSGLKRSHSPENLTLQPNQPSTPRGARTHIPSKKHKSTGPQTSAAKITSFFPKK